MNWPLKYLFWYEKDIRIPQIVHLSGLLSLLLNQKQCQHTSVWCPAGTWNGRLGWCGRHCQRAWPVSPGHPLCPVSPALPSRGWPGGWQLCLLGSSGRAGAFAHPSTLAASLCDRRGLWVFVFFFCFFHFIYFFNWRIIALQVFKIAEYVHPYGGKTWDVCFTQSPREAQQDCVPAVRSSGWGDSEAFTSCLPFVASPPYSPTDAFLTSETNHLQSNLCLKVCFWGC